MTLISSKGSPFTREHARKLAVKVLKGAVVVLMSLITRLESENSTVEIETRYDRPVEYDRYDRLAGSR